MAEAPRVSATVDEPPWLAALSIGCRVASQLSRSGRSTSCWTTLSRAMAIIAASTFSTRRGAMTRLAGWWTVRRAACRPWVSGPAPRLACCCRTAPYFVISFFAVLKIGGTVVNYNPLYTEREIEHQIEDSETDVMVTLDLELLLPKLCTLLERTRLKAIIVGKMADILPFPKNLLFPWVKRHELAEVPGEPRFVWFNDLVANDGRYHAVAIDPATDLAVLQYTGGTTGRAQGYAALTHHNPPGQCRADRWRGIPEPPSARSAFSASCPCSTSSR